MPSRLPVSRPRSESHALRDQADLIEMNNGEAGDLPSIGM
jgi:hypothetical protein